MAYDVQRYTVELASTASNDTGNGWAAMTVVAVMLVAAAMRAGSRFARRRK